MTAEETSKLVAGTTYDTIEPTPNEDPEDQVVDQEQIPRKTSPWKSLVVLLLGVFVSQLDGSLVLATYGYIASEFHELSSGSWIVSSFLIAQCSVQPLYGKLSDIYGRKSCLLTAYSFFIAGTLGVSLSRSFWEVVAWRALQGIGGAGMVSLVSIIVTDIVPKNEVALTRSYVNVIQTMGRSCGGAVGGLLTQVIGWRWAFFVQVPPMLIAIILVAKILPTRQTDTTSKWEKLQRVDFIGASCLTLTIIGLCMILDGYSQIPIIIGTSISFVTFLVSTRLVKEPIFPPSVLTLNVVANYLVTLLSVISQISLMTFVPIYYQVTRHSSVAMAGLYLVPAFVGNTLGGLLAGIWIKRTGLYKAATISGPISGLVCAVLLLTWKETPIESLYIFFGGFAMGVVASSTFVGMMAGVEAVAITASGMYFAFNIGAVGGVSAGSAVSQSIIKSKLQDRLGDDKISKAISDIGFVWRTDSKTREIVIDAYESGAHAVNYLEIGCSLMALVLAIFTKGTPLDQPSN